jgi:hypothetical protein
MMDLTPAMKKLSYYVCYLAVSVDKSRERLDKTHMDTIVLSRNTSNASMQVLVPSRVRP